MEIIAHNQPEQIIDLTDVAPEEVYEAINLEAFAENATNLTKYAVETIGNYQVADKWLLGRAGYIRKEQPELAVDEAFRMAQEDAAYWVGRLSHGPDAAQKHFRLHSIWSHLAPSERS